MGKARTKKREPGSRLRFWKTRATRFLVGALLAFAVVGSSEWLIALDHAHQDRVRSALLTKVGEEYMIVWNTRQSGESHAMRFETLDDARLHANKLGLVPGGVPASEGGQIERLWVRSGSPDSALLWKIHRIPHTHRMTFRKSEDLQFFFKAFERGFYGPSPFGHAIYYRPRD